MSNIEIITFMSISGLCSAWLWLFTEKLCLQTTTNRHIRELEQSLTKIQTLIGITSHEIRAPLTAVLATLERVNHVTLLTVNDKQLIQRAMRYVKEHHTYVNRVQDMITVADEYV